MFSIGAQGELPCCCGTDCNGQFSFHFSRRIPSKYKLLHGVFRSHDKGTLRVNKGPSGNISSLIFYLRKQSRWSNSWSIKWSLKYLIDHLFDHLNLTCLCLASCSQVLVWLNLICLGKSENIFELWLLREAFNKTSQTQKKVQTSHAYFGLLNCYFFIAYMGFRDHEMDFESNLFFPSQKWSDTLCSYIYQYGKANL